MYHDHNLFVWILRMLVCQLCNIIDLYLTLCFDLSCTFFVSLTCFEKHMSSKIRRINESLPLSRKAIVK